MQVAYAIAFFLLVGVCETLRNGVFGFNPSAIPLITNCTLLAGALLLLRSDAIYLIQVPKQPIYGREGLGWSWPQSLLGVVLAPVLFCLPVVYGFAVSGIEFNPFALDSVQPMFLQQTVFMIVCQSLFFGEAVVKAFGRDRMQALIISGLSVFIFYIPDGLPQALIAAGSGIYYLTLRLIGTNMLIVALLHGVTIILFGEVISLGLSQDQQWLYSVCFVFGSAVLSMLTYMIFANSPKENQYA